MMIINDYEVSITATYRIKKIDSDYFKDEQWTPIYVGMRGDDAKNNKSQ